MDLEELDSSLQSAVEKSAETGTTTPLLKQVLRLYIQSSRLAKGQEELPKTEFKEPEKYPVSHKIYLFIFIFLIQFYAPFKIISAHMRRANHAVGGRKRENPEKKPPGTPASRTWLVSHVARAGLEPSPDTAVR